MKYLKLFESFEDIERICRKYNIKNYTINTDETINVDYGIDFSYRRLVKLPLKFNKVNSFFNCGYNSLTVLEGSPVEINGDFYLGYNRLVSFQFAPKIIRGDFDCEYNDIRTLEYFPNFIKDDFNCYSNPIFEVWNLFRDTTKIELLNDFDIFRDEDTDDPVIIMDRLNDFLLTIGKKPVEKVDRYKNI
jgi:hypothetical protein